MGLWRYPTALILDRIGMLSHIQPKLEVIKLPKPIESRTVGGALVTATHAVDVQLTLHTAAGPVRCQNTKRCLVIDDEDEFIVGRILLAELGIDVDRQLEHLAARNIDDHEDEIDELTGIPDRGVTVDEKVKDLLSGLVEDAVSRQAIDLATASVLLTTLCQFTGWRLALGDDPPANVPPLKLRLKVGAQPYKCKVRQYSPEKSAFLEEFNNELVRLGWVYQNVKAAGRALLCRPVNNMTEPIVGVMPSLQVVLEKCKGMKFYAISDFIMGFWQLPLHQDNQEILSYMTDKGVFTPTRVPQGSTDAALHFQTSVEEVLRCMLHQSVLVWIDDLLVYADTVEGLIAAIDGVLQRPDNHRLKLSPRKCQIFVTEVKWCGRIISANGIGHDPERIEGLRSMPPPSTAAELQQLLCTSNWMREGLVDYPRIVKPMQECLDKALQGTKRSKRAAAGVQIVLSDVEMESFQNLKDLLAHSAILTYPDTNKQLCLLTDASDSGWGLVVTQVADWSSTTPIHEQQQELLVCMGGSFTGAALNWRIIDKECYQIVHACEKLEYLLLRPQGMKIYCDHRNII
ncbi:Hypothetical protein PHPALM_8504 [Phytophthora palmivora]|uniref:Reverse transcriptase domain-containing protein n=1 Tax=Phytophthora palmivora TaxID=4796 RepID=A0A2P4Y9N1_9STRA|nr:Hypothetical protein PHPALM_8504 [Phytophthora palmivora]